ncbi:MAG: 5-(carboxyamino)imidazole ribonucleotide synthase [Oscillospiraceae bacterium]|jgi:5-(carboxyamino)imidazole ribonucleotide synthase|nr:5-(carboxyamino)imidazole ribonucleotide synthase [Oscillospiraceae bacterium]
MEIIKKRIGIVGGGQLGKMMILEAKRLGFYVAVLDPAADCPAHSICDLHIIASLDDPKGYIELSRQVDVITYEWENINANALENLEKEGQTVYPSVASLKKIQNKYLQNSLLNASGILVPKFALVTNTDDIREFGNTENIGYPLMLKTTEGGYDGKGVAPIMTEDDVDAAFKQLGSGVKELMVEEFINYQKEISVIACRGINGEKTIYPVAENTHTNTILDTTVVPASISKETNEKAAAIANQVMSVFEGVGAFCTEMFLTENGEIYVNEVAPRPHNSGHYTIEACFANQFENHIRAIVGLPFGDTSLIKPAVMVNLIGESDGEAKLLGLNEAYLDPNVNVHFYGKSESKKGRKMGHYTVVGETIEDTSRRAQELKQILHIVGV